MTKKTHQNSTKINKNSMRKRKNPRDSYALTIPSTIRSQQILPERFTTEFVQREGFYIPAALATAAAGNYMSILPNYLGNPFNTAWPYTLGTGGFSFGFHATAVQGFGITDSPLGYNTVASLYTSYKVLSYEIIVTVSPQTQGDNCECVLFPVGGEQIPSTSVASVNLRVMASQPRAISKVCVATALNSSNTLTLKQEVHNLLGYRKQEWMDIAPTAIGSGPVNQGFVGFFLQELNGTNNAQPIAIEMTLRTIIELSDVIQMIL